jgi:hypothetical protein
MTAKRNKRKTKTSVAALKTGGNIPSDGAPHLTGIPRKAYSVEEFAWSHGLSRTSVYELFKARQLQPVKVGKRTLIPIIEAERWLASLANTGVAK